MDDIEQYMTPRQLSLYRKSELLHEKVAMRISCWSREELRASGVDREWITEEIPLYYRRSLHLHAAQFGDCQS